MSERSYTTVDKTGWNEGPWNDEPDKIVWIDEASDLDCLIVRNPSGALCGYVGVPNNHPSHGKSYWSDEGGPDVDVHGGLTFAGPCHPDETEATGICHVPEPGRPDDVWWFGFDCLHARDYGPGQDARIRESYAKRGEPMPSCFNRMETEVYRTVDYVRGEVTQLAAQLMAD